MSVRKSYIDYSRVRDVWDTIDTSDLVMLRNNKTMEYIIDNYESAVVYSDITNYDVLEYGPGIGKKKIEDLMIKKNGGGYYGTSFSD